MGKNVHAPQLGGYIMVFVGISRHFSRKSRAYNRVHIPRLFSLFSLSGKVRTKRVIHSYAKSCAHSSETVAEIIHVQRLITFIASLARPAAERARRRLEAGSTRRRWRAPRPRRQRPAPTTGTACPVRRLRKACWPSQIDFK